MFEMIPFRINNLTRRDDFFSPFLKNFYDDDFFTAMGNMQGSFKVNLKETDDNYFVEAELPEIKKEAIDIDFDNNYLVINTKKDEASEDKKETTSGVKGITASLKEVSI